MHQEICRENFALNAVWNGMQAPYEPNVHYLMMMMLKGSFIVNSFKIKDY